MISTIFSINVLPFPNELGDINRRISELFPTSCKVRNSQRSAKRRSVAEGLFIDRVHNAYFELTVGHNHLISEHVECHKRAEAELSSDELWQSATKIDLKQIWHARVLCLALQQRAGNIQRAGKNLLIWSQQELLPVMTENVINWHCWCRGNSGIERRPRWATTIVFCRRLHHKGHVASGIFWNKKYDLISFAVDDQGIHTDSR